MSGLVREFLFVYGTLKRGSDNAMRRLLAMRARFVSDGWFNGRLYQVSWYPAAMPSELPQDRVYGEVYELTDPGILARLDDYEECGERHAVPWEYRREICPVSPAGGAVIRAWVYVYNRDVSNLCRIASGDFAVQSA